MQLHLVSMTFWRWRDGDFAYPWCATCKVELGVHFCFPHFQSLGAEVGHLFWCTSCSLWSNWQAANLLTRRYFHYSPKFHAIAVRNHVMYYMYQGLRRGEQTRTHWTKEAEVRSFNLCSLKRLQSGWDAAMKVIHLRVRECNLLHAKGWLYSVSLLYMSFDWAKCDSGSKSQVTSVKKKRQEGRKRSEKERERERHVSWFRPGARTWVDFVLSTPE